MALIIVDSREASKHEKLVQFLQLQPHDTRVQELPYGDFLIGGENGSYLLERKTPYDFMGSLKENRLWDQIASMKGDKGVKSRILLEGSLGMLQKLRKRWGGGEPKASGWSPESAIGVALSVIEDWDMPIIPSPSDFWTGKIIVSYAKRVGKPKDIEKILSLRSSYSRDLSGNDKLSYVLEGMVGSKTAVNLLRKFGTLRSVANATIEDLEKTDLVGHKRAEEIFQTFNTQWE